jgi:hypothetical protein
MPVACAQASDEPERQRPSSGAHLRQQILRWSAPCVRWGVVLEVFDMRTHSEDPRRTGKVHPILLWLLGVPIPLILLLLLIRGCVA